MSVLMGSLQLGQDISWHGENVLTDLCLYTDDSTEKSSTFDVSFQLQAVINLTAVKLFMFKRDRWRVAVIEQSSGLTSFLNDLFNEETNLCGTTKKALLVQVNKMTDPKRNNTTSYPLPSKSNLIIYGERRDNSLFIYAHPLIDDMKFLPVYESSTTMCLPCDDLKNDQMVLDEIFGESYQFDYENLVLSAQLKDPSNKLTEIEMIDKIAFDQKDKVEGRRDLISEAKNAMEEKQQLLKMNRKPLNRISKSKPTKLKQKSELSPYDSLTLEQKNMIKVLIKETLISPAKEDKAINQLIYSSVRYVYRNTIISSSSIDQTKLRCVIKMHADFYGNVENIVNLLYCNNDEL